MKCLKKNTLNGFQNSLVNNTSIKNKEQIIKHISSMFDNIGDGVNDDSCMFCGKKLVKFQRTDNYKKKPTRSYIPMISSMQFSNFINNLQIVNVCPICLYLSMLSSFVGKSYGNKIALFISDNDEIMENIAFDSYRYIETNLLGIDKKFNGVDDFILDQICNLISKINEYDNVGYIEIISLCNRSKEVPRFDRGILQKIDLIFIKKILSKNLFNEFKNSNYKLIKAFISGKLAKNYIPYVMNSFKDITTELFNEIEEVYCKMKREKLALIKQICKKVYETNDIDEIKELKSVDKLDKFEELLIKWNENYKKKQNEDLFNIEQYDMLVDFKEFKNTKNRMIIGFMNLNK